MDSNDLINNGLKYSLTDSDGNPNIYLSHEKEKKLTLKIQNTSEYKVRLGVKDFFSEYTEISLSIINGRLHCSQMLKFIFPTIGKQWQSDVSMDGHGWIDKVIGIGALI